MAKVGKTNERTVVATLHREQANALVPKRITAAA